jgi:hypothetical protein
MLLAGLGGCESEPLGPFPVTNATDSFEIPAIDLSDLTTTVDYRWRNSGLYARVNHATTTVSGGASVLIRDAFGTIVYERALSPSLNQSSLIGSPGIWTISVTVTAFTGTLGFQVQKR